MLNPSTIIFGIAFVAVIFSGYADLILGSSWKKFYFMSGVRVFRKQISIESRYSNIPTPSLFEKRLSSCLMGSFTFKELAPNQYGFRQKLFSFTLNHVTHGLITFDTEDNQITVEGYLNWLVLSITILLLVIFPSLSFIYSISRDEFTNLLFTCVFGWSLMFGIPILFDLSRLKIITEIAVELWTRKYAHNHERA